jgi:hypothetical protein
MFMNINRFAVFFILCLFIISVAAEEPQIAEEKLAQAENVMRQICDKIQSRNEKCQKTADVSEYVNCLGRKVADVSEYVNCLGRKVEQYERENAILRKGGDGCFEYADALRNRIIYLYDTGVLSEFQMAAIAEGVPKA